MKTAQAIAISESKEIDRAEIDSLIALSNDLILKAQWPRLNINEQRLVLYMLALIKKPDRDFKTYRISVRELVNVLGITNKDIYREFDKATDGLMTKVIKWLDPQYKDLIKVTWCYYARLAESRGYVEMSFAPELKPFLLALKGHFTIYELRAVIRLKNHYSLRLYQFLKYNQGMARRDGRTSITVALDWLKEYLGADTDGYRNFGPFRQKVLTPSQQDIREKTDLIFDYEVVKEGRKVQSLIFSWRNNPDYDQQELPFDPPIEHQSPQQQPEPSQAQLPAVSDEISKRLQELGFADWRKVRTALSPGDWRLAFADLEFNTQQKSKSNAAISNPGGWLRSRLPDPGQSYVPSKPYQKHLDAIRTKETQAKRQAEAERKRRQEETERAESERRLNDRIDAALKKLSKREKQTLQAEAEEKAKALLPEPPGGGRQAIGAARDKLKTLSKREEAEVRKKATAEVKKHLQQTGSTLQLGSPAGKAVLANRMLEIIARENPLDVPAQARYRQQLESLANQTLRALVREKYQLTGDPA